MVAKSQHPLQLEGRWEEVLQEGHRLKGRRVRVTTIDDPDPAALAAAAKSLFEAIDKTSIDSNPPPLKGSAATFADGVAEDIDRQRRSQ